jgi:peptidoglycan/xylan/chitin deacetylase (PgdA/CDA1 family)
MTTTTIWQKVQGFYQRKAARSFCTRPLTINSRQPLISFTFDDFPRSALQNGGAILERFGLRGTYYASLGLMGRTAPTGPIFMSEDLNTLLERGHELGCHTFAHCHSWDSTTEVFEDSILENQAALARLIPGASFKTFSYPISPPRPDIKQIAADYFACSRGGGQTFNAGKTDLNYLHAYFLEKASLEDVQHLIERNRAAQGWLILATHDVCGAPTRFGCTPFVFEGIVNAAVRSGARILPVAEALDTLRTSVA